MAKPINAMSTFEFPMPLNVLTVSSICLLFQILVAITNPSPGGHYKVVRAETCLHLTLGGSKLATLRFQVC